MAGEKKFSLPDEKVEIKFIKRQKGNITDTRHILYGGMLEGTYITYRPKKLRNGGYGNVLTNEEKAYLESVLGTDLSVYNKKDNYWDRLKIRIGKEGLYLDLSDPEQYIQFKVLESLEDVIAPNIEVVEEAYIPSYKFYIARKSDEARQIMKKVDVNKEAYKFLGKLEDDKNSMIDFLRTEGIAVDESTDKDWLVAELGKMITKDPAKFVNTLKDTSYPTKVLLYKAISMGEIIKKGPMYYTKDGEPLAEPNQQPTLANAIQYLESSMYQEYRIMLMAKTKKK
jgi:hypothetical protein